MMDPFGHAELDQLLETSASWCVSLYMPTHRRAGETPEDLVLLKNLLRDAEKQLIQRNMRPDDARKMLQPARELAQDQYFWVHCDDGLAVFLAPGFHRWYRLPESFEPLLVVNQRFHVTPVLPLVTQEQKFYLLALAQNHVAFYQGDRTTLQQVELERLPKNMDEALRWDTPDSTLQAHTGQPGPKSKKTAVFHGQGGLPDAEKRNLSDFCHAVARVVDKYLADKTDPLLVVAVTELFAAYQEASSYAHLFPEPLSGNPARMSQHELHRAAWDAVQRILEEQQQQVLEDIAAKLASPLVSLDPKEVLLAALDGRVDTVALARGKHLWGTYDAQQRQVQLLDNPEQHPDAEDLLDAIAVETYRRRGRVLLVRQDQLPSSEGEVLLAARFRYALQQTSAS